MNENMNTTINVEGSDTSDRAAGTPVITINESVSAGTPEEIFEAALKPLDSDCRERIIAITNIKDAQEAYKKAENKEEEKVAILVRWLMLCESKEAMVEPICVVPQGSLAEAVANKKIVKLLIAEEFASAAALAGA
jgi:hypothetical protein